MSNKNQAEKVKLTNVRLSFPSLWEHAKFNGESTGKYAATFLIPKTDKEQCERIKKAYEDAITASGVKVAAGKRFGLTDGDESDYEADAGYLKVKATTKFRPRVVNRDRTPLEEDDGVLYPGCRVNAIIEFRVSPDYRCAYAGLSGVQFAGDDEAFGSKGASDEDFDLVEDMNTEGELTI